MEFWNKLSEALKVKGFSTVQIKRLQEAFGHLDAAGLLSLSEYQLLPFMTGRTVGEKREKIETLLEMVWELKSEEFSHEGPNTKLPCYLQITAGGEDAPVLFGEDNTQSHAGETEVNEWLECSAFNVALETVQQNSESSGLATGPRVWRPAHFVVRVGKSTPWLFEAVRMNKRIDLVLHLFTIKQEKQRIEQYFQYKIQMGRIISIRLIQPDVHDPATACLPHRVEFSVMPRTIEVESITGGTKMLDEWAIRGT